MAFWRQASDTRVGTKHTVEASKPVTVVLHSSADLSTLVRLRVKVPCTKAAASLVDVEEDDEPGDRTAHSSGVAVGRLHQLILGLDNKSADARKHSISQIISPELLQLLCQKAVVAKIYKSLMPHQTTLGFQLGDVKSCISLIPLGLWELHEALHTALVKTLTGNNSGVSSSTLDHSSTAWMSVNGSKVVSCDLLAAEPGTLQHASFVEFEVKAQPPYKALMMIKAAGAIKFRLFSPMQALLSDAKSLKAPLQMTDTIESLLADPAKLAAAARQLDGRAVKLLPDERLAFIKSLHPGPQDRKALEDLHNFWLGHYGLKLPSKNFPFLVGVASHPEAESASLEVPSCCVLTNLGLSVLPGSTPGGSCYREAVGLVLEGLQCSELKLLGGEGFNVETNPGTPAASGAQLQLSQAASQAAAAASSSQPLQQPKQFSIAATWTTGSEISKLQAAAKREAAATVATKQAAAGQQQATAAVKPPPAPSVTTAAAAQLMGLQEVQCLETFVADGDVSKHAEGPAGQQPVLGGRRGQRNLDPSRWAKLNEYLAERANQERELKATAMAATGIALVPGAAKPGRAAATSSVKPGVIHRAAPSAAGGPGVPRFQRRKPGLALLAAAGHKPAAAVAAVAKGGHSAAGDASSKLLDPAEPAAAAADIAPAAVQMPVLKKAPAVSAKRAAPAAAAKAPAAKKGKAAADGSSAASKAKAKKPTVTAAAVPTDGSSSAAAIDPVAATSAAAAGADAGDAATAAPKRAKNKASDLDVGAVKTKVLAVYASGGGFSLKGLSVPEMQCYLRANGQKGGPTKKAEVEARLLAFLASTNGAGAS